MPTLTKHENPSDLSLGTIKRLFDQQMIRLTMKSIKESGVKPIPTISQKIRSFDMQFSDAWL